MLTAATNVSGTTLTANLHELGNPVVAYGATFVIVGGTLGEAARQDRRHHHRRS
jgi:hypothetical protein